MQTLKITSLDNRIVNTKYGSKEQLVVNGKWTAFKGDWNKDWVVGGIAKGIFEKKAVNDREYFNISCPPELRQQGGGLAEVKQMLVGISNQIKELKGYILKESALIGEPTPTKTEELVDEKINDDANNPLMEMNPEISDGDIPQ